uniref:carbonic anhydrase n=1 Tax=Platichthys flesus TaxID=8260 RepID=O93587_PLAFE|nr:carbonic anhydrase [Platichthys flesus]
MSWGYAADNGPDKWADNFPVANGPRQSPIDILPGDASFDAALKPLSLKYDPPTARSILNNGHSFQVTFIDDTDSSTLKDGPISGVYRLKQFHFHWGACDEKGSEHTVAGNMCILPSSISCTGTPNTRASEKPLANLTDSPLSEFSSKLGLKTPTSRRFLTPSVPSRPKASRPPSLASTPPACSPGAWTTGSKKAPGPLPLCWRASPGLSAREPISVSAEQMAKFRSLLFSAEGEAECCMVDKYRPPQPLKGRAVRASFK